MKMFVIDVETTGTDVNRCQLLELAMMYVDTDKEFPARLEDAAAQGLLFSCLIRYDEYVFKPQDLTALVMNVPYFEAINGKSSMHAGQRIIESKDLTDIINVFFNKWAQNSETVNICGKNAGSFDLPIIQRCTGWLSKRIRHRVLDIGNFYVDFRRDEVLPDLATVVQRIPAAMELRGISGIALYPKEQHRAAYDVWHTALGVWVLAQQVHL